MAYQDRRHHSDHGDSGRRRREGERHGFGRRKRFEQDDDRSRRGYGSGRDGGSFNAQKLSQRPTHDERGSHDEYRVRDDSRGERRRDGGSGDRRPDRGSRRPGRFSDHSERKASRDRRDDRRGRPPQRQRIPEPSIPDDVEPADLERGARNELRALGRANAENVARHLVMAQRLLNDDPQAAYEHARYAASHAGRVAVVRETTGICAYLAGHYSEALREIRAARRLSGLDLHRAIEVDCERALGHVDKALQAAKATDPRQLDEIERAELAMVVSSLRHEMGQTDLGLIVIEDAIRARPSDSDTLRRLHSVRADRLEDLGRRQEAEAIRERIGPEPAEEDEIEVFDIEEDHDSQVQDQGSPKSSEVESAADPDHGTDGGPGATEPFAPAGETSVDESSDLEPGDGPVVDHDEDAEWPQSFAERVEAEMAELLEAADVSSDDPADTTPIEPIEPIEPTDNVFEESR